MTSNDAYLCEQSTKRVCLKKLDIIWNHPIFAPNNKLPMRFSIKSEIDHQTTTINVAIVIPTWAS